MKNYRAVALAVVLVLVAGVLLLSQDNQTGVPRVGLYAWDAVGANWDALRTSAGALVTSITGNVTVVGPAADGAAVSGNPVRIAGDEGGLTENVEISSTPGDGGSNARSLLLTQSREFIFNGTTWDRVRGNILGLFTQGPAADGVAVSGNPVRIGGKDDAGLTQDLRTAADGTLRIDPTGTTTQPVSGPLTDTQLRATAVPVSGTVTANAGSGTFTVGGPTAAGSAPTGNPLQSSHLNGIAEPETLERDFWCTQSAVVQITFAGAGSTQVIALAAGETIFVCHISFTTSAAANFIMERGTGVDCATGNTDLTGAYVLTANGSSLALDFSPEAALRTTAGAAFCINSSAAATIGGVVSFAQL